MLLAAIDAREIVPVAVIGPPVRPVPVSTDVTVPVPVIELHPNPVLVVHINADVAALHDGIENADGGAELPVKFVRTEFPPIEGKSAKTCALNVGTPDDPLGEANIRFCVCEANTAVKLPEFVIGETVTVNMLGRANPTEVTVPVPDEVSHAGTPDAFSLSTCVPLLLPARLVHPDGPR